MKSIIGFDLDGVIVNNSKLKMAVAKKLGFNLTLKETPAEIIKTKLPLEILQKLQHLIYDDPITSLNTQLMFGAKESLKKITDVGFKYYLISRRHQPEPAINFLKRENMWPWYFNETNSFFVEEAIEKDEKSKKLGVDCFIDDELHVLNQMPSVKRKFLFDPFRVFNEEKFDNGIIKINKWTEFINKIFEYESINF